jgi:lysophospholipase L1-like esterase
MKTLLFTFAFMASLALGRAASLNDATTPAPRPAVTNWLSRHEGFVELTKKGGIDLLFLGDSITDNWRSRGKAVWEKFYAPRHAANFGIGGDRTQHVLWRIDHGELDGLNPKVIVLMIGTNNSGNDRPDAIVDAIKLMLARIHEKCPASKVLLLAIFPRNKPADELRRMETIAKVNTSIAKLDNGNSVRFLDIGPKFLSADGNVHSDIMPDFLHPNEKGYGIWAAAMEPLLEEMMR